MVREHFRREGYVVIEEALPAATVTAWRERACDLLGRAHDIQRSGEQVLSYREVTGEERVFVSPNLRSAINVNILQQGHRYRWHFDANPYTALLYLSTTPSE